MNTHTLLHKAQNIVKLIALPAFVLFVIFVLGAVFFERAQILTQLQCSSTQSVFSPMLFFLVALVGVFLATYVLVILRNHEINALKQLEANRDALLNLTTHQLGMPLATFKWWLEILREGTDTSPAEKEEACDQLQEGIVRLDQIINSLVSATHLRDGQVHYEAGDISLLEAVDSVKKLTAMQLKHRTQTLSVELPCDLPTLHVDGKLLEGVIREVVENASFYSPEGTMIHLRARKAYSRVQIEIEDHGHGIPAEDIPNIFKKFSRASNANGYKPACTGLGLYIAKGIIERAGGSMWLKSELDRGTTVFINLPAAES